MGLFKIKGQCVAAVQAQMGHPAAQANMGAFGLLSSPLLARGAGASLRSEPSPVCLDTSIQHTAYCSCRKHTQNIFAH